ncbi:MAG TPA: FAD-dependent oxidoreductase [Saprospiraceae bacterium]|nr:FAD-dependent oxidoreductase [Saprospiraceae bacterium]
MSEFKHPQNESEFEANFAPIKPLMSNNEAFYESSRCLFCYDAPCVTACPTGIDIPLFIRQINSKNDLGAAKTIYDSNYFAYACGKVCPTEVLCEGACVYNHSDVKPIEIGRLQTYATNKAIISDKQFYSIATTQTKKVAVIGAGPAGISCACELRLAGYEVDVFEAKELPSGLTIHGVAPYKITNEEALSEMMYLEKQFGYRMHYNSPVNTKAELDRIEKNYDAIFLGVGLGSTSEMGVIGENLKNVVGAVEWIEQLRLNHHQIQIPKKVIVLGGGNTAMDAASESARMGAESVIIAYRRSREEMGAYAFEYELAREVGVKGIFNVAPIEIMGNELSVVCGVKFVHTIIVDGKVQYVPNSEFIEECDLVIKATGQSKKEELLQMISGIQTKPNGTIVVNQSFHTTNPKYFAAGDAVSGGQEVVNAVADGKKAASGMMQYLK